MRTRIGAAILLIFSLSVAGCHSPLSMAEATRIAQRRIGEYAQEEGLTSKDFGKPAVSSESSGAWVFDYASVTTPRHLVRIYVESHDVVEVSRMIE